MSQARRGSKLSESVSDYEKTRLENIKRNTEFLESIGIDSIKKEFTPAPKLKSSSRTTTRGISKKPIPDVPLRRSGRVSIDRVKVELEDAKKAGDAAQIEEKESLLSALKAKKAEASYSTLISETYSKPKLTEGPISMFSLNGLCLYCLTK
jgi:hypothetical protein